jgi:hypothetical protein
VVVDDDGSAQDLLADMLIMFMMHLLGLAGSATYVMNCLLLLLLL